MAGLAILLRYNKFFRLSLITRAGSAEHIVLLVSGLLALSLSVFFGSMIRVKQLDSQYRLQAPGKSL